jgi:glucan phosphoethanolaminetransferase (alkaline phosphatase superfamily)
VGSAQQALSKIFASVPVLNIFLPLPQFNSPMYFLMPVAGFFFMFFLVDWANGFFEKKAGFSPLLPALFFGIALAAFYVAIFWYIGNYAQLAGRALTIDEANRLFTQRLKSSGYYLFVLSALLGWASRTVLERIKL